MSQSSDAANLTDKLAASSPEPADNSQELAGSSQGSAGSSQECKKPHHRHYSLEEKLRLVEETECTSKCAVARHHKIPRSCFDAKALLESLGMADDSKLQLSEHEAQIASSLVLHHKHGVDWTDIGGHEGLKRELYERLIMPLKIAGHLKSELLAPPKGVLLYGPPGCGKTLLARAVARSANARFLNLQTSTLTNMWYGESNKLATAVFTLAKKLQPCIVFIDEIDTFLRARGRSDHEATGMMKAQFMTQWDGFTTDHGCKVVVLGATNRPEQVDDAILRRMPVKLHVPLPLSSDVDLKEVAKMSSGMDGSVLRELCRSAALLRATDLVLDGNAVDGHLNGERPICQKDLLAAVTKLRSGNETAQKYSMSNLLKFEMGSGGIEDGTPLD